MAILVLCYQNDSHIEYGHFRYFYRELFFSSAKQDGTLKYTSTNRWFKFSYLLGIYENVIKLFQEHVIHLLREIPRIRIKHKKHIVILLYMHQNIPNCNFNTFIANFIFYYHLLKRVWYWYFNFSLINDKYISFICII